MVPHETGTYRWHWAGDCEKDISGSHFKASLPSTVSCRWGRQHHPLEKIAIIRKVSGSRSRNLVQILWKEFGRKHSECKEAAFSSRVGRMGAGTMQTKVCNSIKNWWNFSCCIVIQNHLWAVKFWHNLEDYLLKNCVDEFSLLSCMFFIILQTVLRPSNSMASRVYWTTASKSWDNIQPPFKKPKQSLWF